MVRLISDHEQVMDLLIVHFKVAHLYVTFDLWYNDQKASIDVTRTHIRSSAFIQRFYLFVFHGGQFRKKLITETWDYTFLFSKAHHPKQQWFQTNQTDSWLIPICDKHTTQYTQTASCRGEECQWNEEWNKSSAHVYDFPEPVWP